MALEDIQDNNAQRVQAGYEAPMLNVSGSSSNQTLESMGLQDASSAAKTAQALGSLAQDVIGSGVALRQKEDFIEAYANAGAGKAIQEMRQSAPAWESIFGPTASVQGAQARALQDAVAQFGNAGLGLVDQNKHLAPEEFHKVVTQNVSKYLTGDSITDALITQKATELVPEITKAHYKANSKYVQELNLQTASKSIYTTLQTYKTMRAMPEDQRSPEGIESARLALTEVLKNGLGMDEFAHRKMVMGILVQTLASGDDTIKNMVLPDTTPDAEEATAIGSADKTRLAGIAAIRKDTLDNYKAQLKQGIDPPVPDLELTDEEEYEVQEATDKYYKVIKEKHRVERAAGRVDLKRLAEAGVDRLTLIKGVTKFEADYGTMDEGEIKEILGAHERKTAGNTKANEDINAYLQGFKNDAGRALYHAQLRQRFPGVHGEMLVLEDTVTRNEPSGNPDIEYEYGSHLGQPVLPNGKPNPAFPVTFEKFQKHYQMNPRNAAMHIRDEELRATMIQGMEALMAGSTTPELLMKKFSSVAPVTPRTLASNPDVQKRLEEEVDKLNGGVTIWNPLSYGKEELVNSDYMRKSILNLAAFGNRNSNIDPVAAVASAAITFDRTHERIGNHAEHNGGVPFNQQMGLLDSTITANEAIKYFQQKQKIPLANTYVINGNVVIQRTNKHGIELDSTNPVIISLKELGNLYNSEVTAPTRKAISIANGKRFDEVTESTISALMYKAKLDGNSGYTREQAVAQYNRQEQNKQRYKQKAVTKLKGITTGITNRFVDIADSNARTVEKFTKGISNFFTRNPAKQMKSNGTL